MLEEQYEQDAAASSLGGVINDFLHGRRVEPETILGAFADLMGAAGVGRARSGRVSGAGGARGRYTIFEYDGPIHGQRPRIPRRPPPPPIDFDLQRTLLLARQELGFQPREPLTKDSVERRRKDLARKHHPDAGGNLERMVRINQAADLLVAQPDLG